MTAAAVKRIGGGRTAESRERFFADERGATAIEYALIVALIFLAVVGAINNYADSTNEMYSEISSALDE